jgi:Zn-dependent protease
VGRLGVVVAAFSVAVTGLGIYLLSGLSATAATEVPVGTPEVPLWLTALIVLVLIGSVVIHECAHGAAARIAGDPTAKEAGRLTLNPIRHLDPIGSVILPAIMSIAGAGVFGWAKPVPVDEKRFRRRRSGDAFVSVAGVAANLILALAASGLLLVAATVLTRAWPEAEVTGFGELWAITRVTGAPLSGAWVVLAEVLKWTVLANLVLFSLNLLPIPPLDGFRILRTVIPMPESAGKLGGLGFLLLIVLVATGAIQVLFVPAGALGAFLTYFPAWLAGL